MSENRIKEQKNTLALCYSRLGYLAQIGYDISRIKAVASPQSRAQQYQEMLSARVEVFRHQHRTAPNVKLESQMYTFNSISSTALLLIVDRNRISGAKHKEELARTQHLAEMAAQGLIEQYRDDGVKVITHA